MVNYSGLWEIMKNRGYTQYGMMKQYGISPDTFTRIRTNKNLSTGTLEKLCRILECNVCDILCFVEDKNDKV